MRIPVVHDYLRRKAQRRLREIMRGYRKTKADGELRAVAAIKQAVSLTPCARLPSTVGVRWSLLEGDAERSVRQFLLVRLVAWGFGEAILKAKGTNRPVMYPLPKAWRAVLRGHGVEVAEVACAILWMGTVAMYLANGVLTLVKLNVQCIYENIRPVRTRPRPYAYFDALAAGNLPLAEEDGQNYDIVSWYMRWPGRRSPIECLRHGVVNVVPRVVAGASVEYMRAPYPMLHTPKAALQFLVWSLGSTFAAVCALFAGNWWRAMMLSESAKAWLVQLQQPEVLARDYLFHNSNWIYRPLWTYPAEKKGSRILFYFYSTNVEQFKQLGVYPEPLYGWKCTSWPNYLVWDEAQKNFLLRANVAEAAVEVVGPITFHAGSLLPTDLPEHSIAVFDVQPMRDAVYQPLAIDLEYYVPLVASGFLADIAHCTKNSRYHIVLKRKRDVGSRVHPRYRKTLEDLAAGQRFVEIDPNVSAQALIEKSAAVISAPFTSTALLARELGKPSAYYDPSGLCEPDDRAAHGVPVLAGRAELARWLASLA